MKSKLVALASILCIASLMVSGANAGKPDSPPGKGDKTPKTNTELIVFTGDLQGWAHVEGCCPNAGPSPRYTMYLPRGLVTDSEPPTVLYPAGIYDGELFINIDGVGLNSGNNNIVQFHACCTAEGSVDRCQPTNLPELKFQIRGGEGVEDGRKKDRVSTVTFENAPYSADTSDWNKDEHVGKVSFTITKAQSCTEDIGPCKDFLPHSLCPSS